MYQSHFIADLRHWTDLVERRRAESGTSTMTVGQVRRWLNGEGSPAERRGQTPEVADLVILLVAAATDRVLVSAGQPVARPEVGKVRDDWELRSQELPTPAIWSEALQRAGQMGVVPTSTLLSAAAVADLSQKVRDEVLAGQAQPVRDLPPRLEAAYARFALGLSGDRLRTAQAALDLVDGLQRRPDHVPDVLAGLDLPTTAAALGTSVRQSTAVAAELNLTNWQLLAAIEKLADPWKDEAASIRTRLTEALLADELVISLPPRLRSATSAATDLLARAATPKPPPLPPPPPPPPPRYDRDAAEADLRSIRQKLRDDAGVDLVWEFQELPHEG
jgi:hypothetical protein